MSLAQWSTRERPHGELIEGRYARLEKLDANHGDTLYEASLDPDRYRWLFDHAPADRATFDRWLEGAARGADPLFYAVVDRATGRAEGRQAYLRMAPEHGVIEIGSILWGPRIARTRIATEALWLFAQHAFVNLGYRRFEWKCDSENTPSREAALRFGFTFEGIFKQHMVVKQRNRDTAWFAIVDGDWPRIGGRLERWLDPKNFAESGEQRRALRDL